jgi:hypothetical protein
VCRELRFVLSVCASCPLSEVYKLILITDT